MILKTQSVKINSKTARVYWNFPASSSKGCFECVSEFRCENIDIVAEIFVIQELFETRKITGNPIFSGKNVELWVSKKDIKLLALKPTGKNQVGYAEYLRMVLEGADYKVHSEDLSIGINCAESLFISSKSQNSVITVDLEKIGEVVITRHAIERFKEAMLVESGSIPQKPLATLIKRLKNKSNFLKSLPKKVVEHKRYKYPGEEGVEVWTHESSTLHYVLIKNKNGKKTLLTVYIRKDYE